MQPPMSYGYRLAASYESGFTLLEGDDDSSPYDPRRTIFHAIRTGEASRRGHGRLVSLSLEPDDGGEGGRFLSFSQLRAVHGDTVRPIYFRRMTRQIVPPGPAVCEAHYFGYQYTDEVSGRNVQHVEMFS